MDYEKVEVSAVIKLLSVLISFTLASIISSIIGLTYYILSTDVGFGHAVLYGAITWFTLQGIKRTVEIGVKSAKQATAEMERRRNE